MGLTPDLVTGVWVGAEDRSVRFNTLSLGMGTNTALPIFAYYTKFLNADDSLNLSREDFKMPETMIKSPIDCDYKISNTINLDREEDRWYNEDNWFIMINKQVINAKEACKDIPSNATIMLGGFGLCGIPGV